MASSYRSPRNVPETPVAYESFTGLETIRDDTSQDVGRNQPLAILNNGFVDSVGQIVKEPGLDRISSASGVTLVKHLDLFDIVWLQKLGGNYRLTSSQGQEADFSWPLSAIPSMGIFSQKIFTFAQGEIPFIYDGARITPLSGPLASRLRPSFGTTVQSRFCVAGMPQYPGVVEISRVNNTDYFSTEEKDGESSVLRAGKIDVQNILGSREPITGLHPFETNKLLIFTGSRGILYNVSTNIDEWSIEGRTAISSGCISHNTIQAAGSDVLYCSRTGVHSVLRSRQNGVMVYSMPMSEKISLLYRQLVRSVPDPRMISAVWDADESQYHIFFPFEGAGSIRLTMSINPTNQEATPRWSMSSGIPQSCGDFYQGSLVYGSPEGVFQVGQIEEDFREFNPDLVFQTPTLYLGSFTEAKDITHLAMSCFGNTTLVVELLDPLRSDEVLWSKEIEVTDEAKPDYFEGVPITRQRMFPVGKRTTQVRLRVTAKGKGLFRLAGFAFIVGRNK